MARLSTLEYRSALSITDAPPDAETGSRNRGDMREQDVFLGTIEDDHKIVNTIAWRLGQTPPLAAVLKIAMKAQVSIAKRDVFLTTSGYVPHTQIFISRFRGGVKTRLKQFGGTINFMSLAEWNQFLADDNNTTAGRYTRVSSKDIETEIEIDFASVSGGLRSGDLLKIEQWSNAINGNATVEIEHVPHSNGNPFFSIAAV